MQTARSISAELLLQRALADGVWVRQRVETQLLPQVIRAASLVYQAVRAGHKILLCGNGGSASDAQHIAAELVGRYVSEREPLPAIALHTDTSALTAIGNDYGFEQVYARPLRALGNAGDVLIAITTSGRSPNVLAAVQVAREKGLKIIGLTGQGGQAFADACDVGLAVPSNVTARIQELHITIGHLFCEYLDAALAGILSDSAPEQMDETHRPAAAMPRPSSKILDRAELAWLSQHARAEKRKVVWTNGAFDVFHAGHLASLRAAKALGDVLVVGVNDDASVRGYKGPQRPIFPCAERVEVLEALGLVDFVHVFSEATPEAALAILRPDIHCKGADYAPPNGKAVPEAALVESYGGQVAFLPWVQDRSTTGALSKILAL